MLPFNIRKLSISKNQANADPMTKSMGDFDPIFGAIPNKCHHTHGAEQQ